MALNSTALLPDGKGLFICASILGFERVDRVIWECRIDEKMTVRIFLMEDKNKKGHFFCFLTML